MNSPGKRLSLVHAEHERLGLFQVAHYVAAERLDHLFEPQIHFRFPAAEIRLQNVEPGHAGGLRPFVVVAIAGRVNHCSEGRDGYTPFLRGRLAFELSIQCPIWSKSDKGPSSRPRFSAPFPFLANRIEPP